MRKLSQYTNIEFDPHYFSFSVLERDKCQKKSSQFPCYFSVSYKEREFNRYVAHPPVSSLLLFTAFHCMSVILYTQTSSFIDGR